MLAEIFLLHLQFLLLRRTLAESPAIRRFVPIFPGAVPAINPAR